MVEAVTLDQAKQVAKRLWGQGLMTVIVGRARSGRTARVGGAGGELRLSKARLFVAI